jgi:hypothetical protein
VLCGRLPRPGPETAKYIAKANVEYTPSRTEPKDKGRGAKKSEEPKDEEEEADISTLESRIAMIITKACGIIYGPQRYGARRRNSVYYLS